MLVVIDYGMGNIGSIQNMIKKIGGKCLVSGDPETIDKASKLILPGVGSFDAGMRNLRELGLIDILNKKVVIEKVPILGICLGMQLLTRSSEEGMEKGLGWIHADVIKFDSQNLKVPHMGWNVSIPQKQSRLFVKSSREERFYFVHSYYVKCDQQSDILTSTNYGIEFVSAFENENIFGVQFHPEKSHLFGMDLLRNFVEL